MRLAESEIKAAILNPETEIREQALHFFSDVGSCDQSVMPLVISAVEQYGRDKAFSILRDAEHLAQSNQTVEWLIAELRRQYDFASIEEDNYRYAVGITLVKAAPELLALAAARQDTAWSAARHGTRS